MISLVAVEATEVVTSKDLDARLAPFYEQAGIKPGIFESLAGITERRQWPADMPFTEGAAIAGEKAIAEAGIDRNQIGLLIDTSVSKERLEPSSSVTTHDRLGLGSHCMNFDVANACLGFLNGIYLAGLMVDSGQIDYALVVDSENSRRIQNATVERLLQPEATLADLFSNFASLTLGSGAAAMVIGRHSDNPGSHRIRGGLFRSDSTHHDLCVGSLDQMRTDAAALLVAGSALAKTAWEEANNADWSDADCYILHQVSRAHTAEITKVLGIDSDRVPQTFPTYGNIGPAAIPITLATAADSLTAGDRVLCLGIGSGLNAAVLELIW